MVRVLKSINFSCVAAEDRILAAINPGVPEAWSCWLTRRLVLALLDRTSEFLASTSPVVQQPARNRFGTSRLFFRGFFIRARI